METQERILTKSHELFMRYGIRSVSMDEIAAQLGISKKTIYQFYTDKDALVDDVIRTMLTHNERECNGYCAEGENAIQEIFLAVSSVKDLLSTMNVAVVNDLEKYHPKAFERLTKYKTKFLYESIKNNLERGKAEELYRPEIKTDILSRYRIASVFLLFSSELFHSGKHNLVEVMNEVTDVFLYGIATAKGQKIILKYKKDAAAQGLAPAK